MTTGAHLGLDIVGQVLVDGQVTNHGQLGVLQAASVPDEVDNVRGCLLQGREAWG